MLHLWLLSRPFAGHFRTSKPPSQGAGTRPGCSIPVMLPLVLPGSLHLSRLFLVPFTDTQSFFPHLGFGTAGTRAWPSAGQPLRHHAARPDTLWPHGHGYTRSLPVSPSMNLFSSLFNIFHCFTHSIWGGGGEYLSPPSPRVIFPPAPSRQGSHILTPTVSPCSPGGSCFGQSLAQSLLFRFRPQELPVRAKPCLFCNHTSRSNKSNDLCPCFS